MIHGMMLVRNEATRELQVKHDIFNKVLDFMKELCDRVVIFDDGSTDCTPNFVACKIGSVYGGKNRMWDKNEVQLRKELWEKTIAKARHGDWIICLDADELIDNPEGLKYMLEALPPHIDGLGFRLFDMWDMEHYRSDDLWRAHFFPWTFAVRYDKTKKYVWHEKALHCGRFPANASERMLPTMIPVRHFGWALEEDRKKKYDRYMRIDGDGKHGILAQYESILDKKPNLVKFGGAE